ncbi:MAG TPA: hypothetical protein PLT23_06210, partial [Lentisphaeria bacterium]|nr:hypothetical protein [Lentisphaeria bacterium]
PWQGLRVVTASPTPSPGGGSAVKEESIAKIHAGQDVQDYSRSQQDRLKESPQVVLRHSSARDRQPPPLSGQSSCVLIGGFFTGNQRFEPPEQTASNRAKPLAKTEYLWHRVNPPVKELPRTSVSPSREAELELTLSMHNITGQSHVDILEVTLPKDWPENGILNVGVDENGFCPDDFDGLYVGVSSKDDAPTTEPLLVLHVLSRRYHPSIYACDRLKLAGCGTILGQDCCLTAKRFTASKNNRNLLCHPPDDAGGLGRFQRLWTDLASQATKIDGDLLVKAGEALAPGVYLVSGDVRMLGRFAGPCTILSIGKVVIKGRRQEWRPAIGNALLVSQSSVFLAGDGIAYRGDICSLSQVIHVFGRQQHFLGAGLWAESVTVKGIANAFTSLLVPVVETEAGP